MSCVLTSFESLEVSGPKQAGPHQLRHIQAEVGWANTTSERASASSGRFWSKPG